MFVAMVTNWLTCLPKCVKMAAAHEQKKQMSRRNQDNGQPQNFDASVLRSVISSLIKKKDNPLSKSAFLSRESNFNKSNCLSAIFVYHTSVHSLTVRFRPMSTFLCLLVRPVIRPVFILVALNVRRIIRLDG